MSLHLITGLDAMSRVIKYTVKVKAPYNKSLQCEKCKEYLWIPFWGYWLNSNCKCKNRQSKYE